MAAAAEEKPVPVLTKVKEREDEPTEVTKLLSELEDARAEARLSLVEARATARHLSRRLRGSKSQQALRAITSDPPPAPTTNE